MPRANRATLLSTAAIVFAGVLAYAPSFRGALVLDDHPTIEANPSIRSLASWAVLTPPPQVGTAGRPLANLTFALNHALGGTVAGGYHLVNLAIHLGTALLLAGIVRRTLSRPAPAAAARNDLQSGGRTGTARVPAGADARATWLATAIAALWAVHPLGTQTVTYISQRTEALAAAGIVAVVYCLTRYAESGRRRWLILGWAAGVFGVASKETAVTAPVIAFVVDGAFIAGSVGAAWRARRGWYLSLATCWVLLAILMTHADLVARGVGLTSAMSPWEYALVECRALLTYFRLSCWPHPLVFDYGWAPPVSSVAVAFVIAAIGVTVVGLRRGCAWAWLALLWFLLLAPSSSVIPVAEQPIAENRTYLASCLVVAGLVMAAYRLVGWRLWPVVGLAAVALLTATAVRNRQFASEAALWRDTAAKRPLNARAWNALGLLQYKAGDAKAALALHQKAAALRPTYAEAEGNIGADLLLAQRPAEAVGHFRRALEIEPQLPGGRSNLVHALLAAGNARLFAHDAPGAIEAYEEALRTDPEFAFAHNNLASALLQLGRFEEALEHAVAALKLDPNYLAAHGTAGTAALQLGRVDEAIAQFRAALSLEPSAASHTGLGLAFARKGERNAAIAEFRAALQLNPDFAPAQQALHELGM